MAYGVGVLQCSEDGCEETIKAHYWGRVKSGWFFSRAEDKQWCPNHIPEWVAEWRARKAAEK